jgi:hypothetical protein
MYRTVTRIKSSILVRACVLVTIATLGTTWVATDPASARAPRPGAKGCKLPTLGLTVNDGSEIEVTISVPPSQGGGFVKLRYECDNGTWVEIARFGGIVNRTVVSTNQLATAVIYSRNTTLIVKLRGPAIKAIPGPIFLGRLTLA